MQQSNAYILVFSAIMTILLGGLLSFTSTYLKPLQQQQEELDQKKKILSAVRDISQIKEPDKLLSLYERSFSSVVLNIEGEEVEVDKEGKAIQASDINIQKNHKLPKQERLYPLYVFRDTNTGQTKGYVFPMFGSGLWDWISAYVALSEDLNTVLGISFDHKAETPGLGARITSAEVQDRYKGKRILDTEGRLASISMLKGEKGLPLGDHELDGMSGATMTGKGVNTMLKEYFSCYYPYIAKKRGAENNREGP